MALVLQQKKLPHWVRYVHQRIKKNKNFIGFVGGPTGSGKSWTCLRIAEELDPRFNISQVVFKAVDLMELINGGTLKSGSVIIFEEAGVEMSNRNWQSTVNKVLNYLFQTFRHRRFILIMNSPYMDFVDAATRKLFHAEFQTMSIDEKAGKVKLKAQLIQYNGRRQKFYYKYLRVIKAGGGIGVLKYWKVSKPAPKLIKEYEKKKKAYTSLLNKEIQADLSRKAEKEQRTEYECGECGYVWVPRSKTPGKCPKCQKFDTYTHKTEAST